MCVYSIVCRFSAKASLSNPLQSPPNPVLSCSVQFSNELNWVGLDRLRIWINCLFIEISATLGARVVSSTFLLPSGDLENPWIFPAGLLRFDRQPTRNTLMPTFAHVQLCLPFSAAGWSMCTYARLMPVLNLAFRSLPSAESLNRNCGFALHAFLCKCFVLHDYCFRCSVFFGAVAAACCCCLLLLCGLFGLEICQPHDKGSFPLAPHARCCEWRFTRCIRG